MANLYPFANDLFKDDSVPDWDETARYCRPGVCDPQTHDVLAQAFFRADDEHDLSVNRLQYFVGSDRAGAVACIRDEVRGYRTLSKNGRFMVVGVGDVKQSALAEGFNVEVIYSPMGVGSSHSSIFGLPAELPPTDPGYEGAMRVAVALLRLIKPNDVFFAVL